MFKLLLLMSIIAVSTLWLYALHLFAPNLYDDDSTDRLTFPSNLEELRLVASTLQKYSVDHWWYVFLIFSSAYVYKQAFCIPGSIFLNMLSGALYGSIGGLLFACVFTATGASVCYTLSKVFGKELVTRTFPREVKIFRDKVNGNKDRLIYFMLFLRLITIMPGWLINVAAPLVDVPIKTFYISTLLGLGPYNFVGVSAGSMLSSLQTISDVFSWQVLLNISVIGVIALGPAFVQTRYEGVKVNVDVS